MGTGMIDFGTGRNRLAHDLPGSEAVLSSRMGIPEDTAGKDRARGSNSSRAVIRPDDQISVQRYRRRGTGPIVSAGAYQPWH